MEHNYFINLFLFFYFEKNLCSKKHITNSVATTIEFIVNLFPFLSYKATAYKIIKTFFAVKYLI